jgi:ArsR family metal-binding transcriptional regulator
MRLINEIEITQTMPCLADPDKIRFIARVEVDISDIFPYLNGLLKKAIYNHQARTLTLRKEDRLITLHLAQIAAAKIRGDNDAAEIIDWLKERINYCLKNRASLEPSFERRDRLTALDIYKLLPGTNCRRCGERTCLAYAVRLAGEELNIMKCEEIFLGTHTQKRQELLRLLKASGYEVPGVFVSD